jgi:hypothetical protein
MPDETEAPTSAPETRVHAVRWDVAELERFEAAAKALSEREHFPVTVTDIIRRGARREADAILQAA